MGGVWLAFAWLVAASAVQPARAADTVVAGRSMVGAPQSMRDLHWGDVLFYFYQGDHLQALTRLDAGQQMQRLDHHALEAALLKGGLYLSLGQHARAGQIFQPLLNDTVPLDVRNRAWFYLAKVWYQRNYMQDAIRALQAIQGALPGELEPQRHLLEAQLLIYMERYEEAVKVLSRWQPVGRRGDIWSHYARFNIGVALVRQGRVEEAAELLDEVGRISAPNTEWAALRDKANLALGFAWLKVNRAEDARVVLRRVRLQGVAANQALLGAGWAEAADRRYRRALVPWLELRGRDRLDASVQESHLAVPYIYAQLGAEGQAAQQYLMAVESFAEESRRIDESIQAVRDGGLLQALLANDRSEKVGWYWQLLQLPDAPATRYLHHLLASHRFQEALKSYRDLQLMQRNLTRWSQSLNAFDDMVDARRRAYQQRLPVMQRVLDAVDLDAMDARKNHLLSRLEQIERESDAVALAPTVEQASWARVLRLEQALDEADATDPKIQEMREKVRLLRGRLLWDFDAAYKARLWQARRQMRDVDVSNKEARRRWVLVERAREDYPQRTEQFAQRVVTLKPRIDALSQRVAVASEAQQRFMAALAVRELQAQQQRLREYSMQARFALAAIYDRTATDSVRAESP